MSRKKYYTQEDVDYSYEELEPTIEALHSAGGGYALAAALKKHAKEIIAMEDEILKEEYEQG